MSETVAGPDGKPRCGWCGHVEAFFPYHDNEWGFPVADDRVLFEKLCLETFQSGLNWRTILAKRENFRKAFKRFEIDRVAAFSESDIGRLLQDKGIVRHRGKIEAVINNARRAQALIAREGSLAAYVWQFEPAGTWPPQSKTTSAESVALAKALKKQGWQFVGPTTVFAFMQAMGLVNDHLEGCAFRAEVARARRAFKRP